MNIGKLTIGARNLLNKYKDNPMNVAEAYVKGDIPQLLEPFVWDIVTGIQIAIARDNLKRTSWRLEERVAKLEKEVKELQYPFDYE